MIELEGTELNTSLKYCTAENLSCVNVLFEHSSMWQYLQCPHWWSWGIPGCWRYPWRLSAPQGWVVALIIIPPNECQPLQTFPWRLTHPAHHHSISAQWKPRKSTSQTEGLGTLQFPRAILFQSHLGQDICGEKEKRKGKFRTREDRKIGSFGIHMQGQSATGMRK